MYEDKIKERIFSFRKVVFDFERELDREEEKGRGKVAKGFFGFTFDGVRDNKDGIERKALSSKKRERAIIIHQKCIVCERPACKNLKAYYYAFLKIALKGGALSART